MRKNLFIVLLLCVMLVLGAVSGCGSSQSTPSAAPTEAPPAAPSEAPPAKTEAPTPEESVSAPEPAEMDYSSLEVWQNDPDFPDGAYFFKDLKDAKVWGDIPVADKEIKIGYIVKSLDNSFWQGIKNGVEEEAQKLKDQGFNVTIDVKGAQGESDVQGQLAIMQDMVNKKYDAIVFHPISDVNMVPGIEEAQQANIPIVTGNQQFNDNPQVPYFFGMSEYYAGSVAANYIIEKLGSEGGQIAVVSGISNDRAARSRTAGFADAIAAAGNPNLTIVDTQNADWDRAKAKNVVDTQLKKYPDIKAIYCNNDTMAMGALEGVRGVDKIGQIIVGGIDATDEAVQSINNGELTFSIAAYPDLYGKIGVEMAFRVLAGQEVPPFILGQYVLVDKTNASADAKQVLGWTDFAYIKG